MCNNQPTRVWFLNQGCKQVPLDHTRGIVRWAHPDGYFLNAQGQKVAHTFSPSNQDKKRFNGYPTDRATGGKSCHYLMALAFYGPKPQNCQCHHLNGDRLNYRPANLLCWLTRAEHSEADRRQRALKKVVPDGDLRLFTYERLRELQDPRTMSRAQFETELAALAQQGFYRDNLTFDQRMDRDMSHHCEH